MIHRPHPTPLPLPAVSKGVLGECGLRGGYVELTNFHPGTVDELYKVRCGWRNGFLSSFVCAGEGSSEPAHMPLVPPHQLSALIQSSLLPILLLPPPTNPSPPLPAPSAPTLQAVSINLSPNTMGQVAMSLMVNPPQPGSESYEQWKREHDEGLASLR